ncbi:MAG: sigma 54-interacting transcriptional regulator [Sandaracinaceae bacterium]
MHVLMLCYRDEPIREFPVATRALEVGTARGCDIVVHDPEVAERQLLVRPSRGTLLVQPLDGSPARILPPNHPLPLGRFHSLVRIPDAPTGARAVPNTEVLPTADERPGLSLVIGHGADARRVALTRALTVGKSEDADVQVFDRTVSGMHCRFEPSDHAVRIRDIGSCNGTYVDSVLVEMAEVTAGSRIRIGRTDLRLVRRAPAPQPDLVAASPAMHELLERVERYARFPRNVLVRGESGAGKEHIARALHTRGPRKDGPFVAINAGGMPATLVESQLFGHEKGAFTGADTRRRGLFEQADGGTLFLDEIGELPLELQSRLLRVLETWKVRRVGAEREIDVDVRLVCATHRDLRLGVQDGRFRQDLYYRIAQLRLEVPPLRERPEDIDALAQHFLRAAPDALGPRLIEPAALAYLRGYAWPGNARELRSVVERAALESGGAVLSSDDVRREIEKISGVPFLPADQSLVALVAAHRGNLTAAARTLGIPRTTLRDRLAAEKRKVS